MNSTHALQELARLHAVETSYVDLAGERRHASPEALRAVLGALGVERLDDPREATERRLVELRQRLAEPVVVAWEGRLHLVLQPDGPKDLVHGVQAHLTLEDGSERRLQLTAEERSSGGLEIAWPDRLPHGYHRLVLSSGGRWAQTEVISAPQRAFRGEAGETIDERPGWGLFLPLYALSSENSSGIGDTADLERLVDWASERGADAVGTLPLYATFSGAPDPVVDPSPYAPVSRLFWNELYLHPNRLPELATTDRSGGIAELLDAPWFRTALGELRIAREIDYQELVRVKGELLRQLASAFFSGASDRRRGELEAFLERRPETRRYAAFRALGERRGQVWQEWPEEYREGELPEAMERGASAETPPQEVGFHLWAQWVMDGELRRVAARARERGRGLYLDLPLGVHGSSYDVWRHQDLFVTGVSVGSPPDPFFTQGQGWGFPPLHPERLRAEGHRYFRQVIRRTMELAGILRIDHVMQLHRLFWIPDGGDASDGLYVRYPAEELLAILCLESHRARTILVGENLGTVPPEVDRSLAIHGIGGMEVTQFGLSDDAGAALPEPRADLVSLDTHDTPSFPAFLDGADLTLRRRLGHLDREAEESERARRRRLRDALVEQLCADGRLAADSAAPDAGTVTAAALEALAASDAPLLMISLEDLWGETEPQNVPGTGGGEYPSWRRKSRLSFEEFRRDPRVTETLARVEAARTAARPGTTDETSRARPTANEQERADSMSQNSDTLEAVETSADLGEVLGGERLGEALGGTLPLTDDDLHLFNEGRHFQLYDKLGAHPMEVGGTAGTYFAVWAPGASSAAVVGEWNGWDGESHRLTPRSGSGIWEGFVPGVGPGTLYKYRIRSGDGGYRVDKADPFGFEAETPPATGSVVARLEHEWGDAEWMAGRGERQRQGSPISIYEVHLGSWRRMPEEDDRSLTYRELAETLPGYVAKLGFTHVELLPIMEHPFYGSWGYQTTGYFAPTSRYGSPADFMALVDAFHQAGVGVILDWVPSHFPSDEHGLAYFDGTHLFEHADPRQGYHPDWGSLIFNYGRHEVRSFLISSGMFWLDRYHIDGLRVDAVASMLYLDYSRKEGEWIPNRHGGRENLEALEFLRQMNSAFYERYPDVQVFAEESTAWPMVSRPTYLGGLGFGFKWDMGWMHDTLQYLERDPIHRKYHHGELTFRGVYAFSENFCLPLSHDEVVHGKGSLAAKMPGSAWDKLANLRLLYTTMTAQPGKKLLFMGAELAQWREWNHDASLDWHLLDEEAHQGIQRLVTDLNRLYREVPALHERDTSPDGFEWIEGGDSENSVVAYLRRGESDDDVVVCVMNYTPVLRHNYRLGVPRGGVWREIFNSDAEAYGGSGQGNLGAVEAAPVPLHGRSHSVTLTLPPYGGVFLRYRPEAAENPEEPEALAGTGGPADEGDERPGAARPEERS